MTEPKMTIGLQRGRRLVIREGGKEIDSFTRKAESLDSFLDRITESLVLDFKVGHDQIDAIRSMAKINGWS